MRIAAILVLFAMMMLFAIKWKIEEIKFEALVYFIVEKEYTEPTEADMERCIKIVVNKTIEKKFKK